MDLYNHAQHISLSLKDITNQYLQSFVNEFSDRIVPSVFIYFFSFFVPFCEWTSIELALQCWEAT